MLSYQHGYHAGNFADVHKHWLLVMMLELLSRKSKPWCYLDTHAGRGYYDLGNEQALKTGEYRHGIARVLQAAEQGAVPEVWKTYIELVTGLGIDAGQLREYPGSPVLAAALQREDEAIADRLVLCELHPQEFAGLKQVCRRLPRVNLHFRDGFEGVLGMIPPQEKRGMVLIDPSYELKPDYERIPAYLEKLSQRWPGGSVAVWYPLLADAREQALIRGVMASGLDNVLQSEIRFAPPAAEGRSDKSSHKGMIGSGMLIRNPPWQLDQQIEQGWDFLLSSLGLDHNQSVATRWLKPESA